MIPNNFINIRRVFFILLLVVSFTTMYGQQTTPVNEKYVNVDLFHGNLNVTIPLYTVKGRTLNCPVSLNYSQVNINGSNTDRKYYAGATGLGWSLVGGGCITRRINGLPDETNFNNSTSTPKGNFLNTLSDFNPDVNTDYDPEEDDFTFNFGGHSGTFMCHKGEWKIFSDEDFEIRTNISLTYGLSGFTIITRNGMIYEFGGEGLYTGDVHPSIGSIDGTPTAWYLTRITSSEGETIDFSYINADVYYPAPSGIWSSQRSYYQDLTIHDGKFNMERSLLNQSDPSYEKSSPHTCRQVLLKGVGNISFNYIATTEKFPLSGGNRNPLKLNSVEVVSGSTTFKKYDLTYDDKAGESLKLTSVQESATTGSTITGTMPAFTFTYADQNNSNNPQALTQLTYPTGGYTTFEYEYASGLDNLRISKQTSYGVGALDKALSTIYFYGERMTNTSLLGIYSVGGAVPVNNAYGGLDITDPNYVETEQNSVVDNIPVKYDLPAGVYSTDPLVGKNTFRYNISSPGDPYTYEVDVVGIFKDRLPNATVQQKETGYSSVWVAQLATDASNKAKTLGYKHFSFVNFRECDANNQIIYQNANDVGKMTQYEEFDSNAEFLSRVTYEYKRINEKTLGCYTIHSTKYKDIKNTNLIWYVPYIYILRNYKYKLAKETEEYPSGLCKRTEYEYDSSNALLRTKKVLAYHPDIDFEGNDGEPYSDQTTTYRYFSDFVDPFYHTHDDYTPHPLDMDMPIETIYKRDGKITGVEFATVTIKKQSSSYSGCLKPETIYTLDITQPINETDYAPVSNDLKTLDSKLKPRVTFEYDNDGNLVGQAETNGQKICYIGGSGSYMPLEVVKGMTYAEYMNSTVLNNNSDYENVMTKRAAFPGIQITSYTYDPTFETPTSVTAPNGLTTYYEYDSFGRLHYVKDTNKNILKTYEYTGNVQ